MSREEWRGAVIMRVFGLGLALSCAVAGCTSPPSETGEDTGPNAGDVAAAEPVVGSADAAGPVDLPEIRTLWNFRDPAASEARFREVMVTARAEGRLGYELELRTQIARTLGLRKRFDEAHAQLDRVDAALAAEPTHLYPMARMRSMLERGRTYSSSGNQDEGRACFERAYEFGLAHDLGLATIDAAHMLGIAYEGEKSVEWNLRAMELCEASEDPRARGWLPPLYNNLGWHYHDEEQDYERALELFRKGEEIRRELGGAEPGLRIARNHVGRALRLLGRSDEALEIQTQLLADWEEADGEDGFVHEEMGELLLAAGRPDEARPHFEKAWELLREQKWLEEYYPGRLTRLERLASGTE